jgi:hypothetical protein
MEWAAILCALEIGKLKEAGGNERFDGPCRQFKHLDGSGTYFFFLSSFFLLLSEPHFPQDMFLHLLADLIGLMQLRMSVFESLSFISNQKEVWISHKLRRKVLRKPHLMA